jgi:hypothetical protein
MMLAINEVVASFITKVFWLLKQIYFVLENLQANEMQKIGKIGRNGPSQIVA